MMRGDTIVVVTQLTKPVGTWISNNKYNMDGLPNKADLLKCTGTL